MCHPPNPDCHASNALPKSTPLDMPGEYAIDKLWLPMAGRWDFTLELESLDSGNVQDRVLFSLCVEDG
jgi:hypothetical protein